MLYNINLYYAYSILFFHSHRVTWERFIWTRCDWAIHSDWCLDFFY